MIDYEELMELLNSNGF